MWAQRVSSRAAQKPRAAFNAVTGACIQINHQVPQRRAAKRWARFSPRGYRQKKFLYGAPPAITESVPSVSSVVRFSIPWIAWLTMGLAPCRDGGTGRRSGLKIRSLERGVGVRVPLSAPIIPIASRQTACGRFSTQTVASACSSAARRARRASGSMTISSQRSGNPYLPRSLAQSSDQTDRLLLSTCHSEAERPRSLLPHDSFTGGRGTGSAAASRQPLPAVVRGREEE